MCFTNDTIFDRNSAYDTLRVLTKQAGQVAYSHQIPYISFFAAADLNTATVGKRATKLFW